jgi:DNA replication protein DnaC
MKYYYLHGLSYLTLFVSFPELLAEIRDTYDNTEKRESEVMKKYLDANLLVLDDFLSTRPTDWVIDILYYLINHRFEYLKKTIITCNMSLEELEKRMGDQRITSRINLMCEIEEKKINWKCLKGKS